MLYFSFLFTDVFMKPYLQKLHPRHYLTNFLVYFYFILFTLRVNLQMLGHATIPTPEAPSTTGQSRAQPTSWPEAARADTDGVQKSLCFPCLQQPVASNSSGFRQLPSRKGQAVLAPGRQQGKPCSLRNFGMNWES